jgi:hypothetical protein
MVRTHALQIWKLRVEELPSGRSSPMVRTCEAFIWKLLTADVRSSGRCAIPSGRGSYTGKISPLNFRKILLHSCPLGRPMSTVRTALGYILLDAHLSPQPINRVPWALGAARIRYLIPQLLRDVIFPLKPIQVCCYGATSEVYLRGRL